MEAICSPETSVDTQRTTRRHIPDDDTLHNHRCENLKSYTTNSIRHYESGCEINAEWIKSHLVTNTGQIHKKKTEINYVNMKQCLQ
jgi:hypothetical protein